MDALQAAINAEMSKKRKTLETVSSGQKKKYVSRAELERIREEEYRKQEEERIAKENERKAKKREEEEKLRLKDKVPEKQSDSREQSEEKEEVEAFNISREEVIRRLRAKGQPIRLFAETDKQCKIRLRALELMEEQTDEGQRNDFMRQLEEMEEGMRLEVLKKGGNETATAKKPKKQALQVEPINLKLIKEDRDKLCLQIYAYLVHTMEEWEEFMAARPQEEKQTTQGKRQAVLQKQTSEYIKPLLRQLKKRTLEADILMRVAEITHHMQDRRYRDAQDSYLQLSIGNAPWPIGVTMVGIHERSAREKIFSSQVAHVLNDETSRKWIQSVKRLMTFAQSKYPPYTLSQIS
ncbi:Prp18 domain-domain-containing protein [Syncephalastrum racemosum]|uniref:Pre-mRNA-splicing factor 18 n=1 Tax=Syncephalastrum racemosum TaxID=13706 RepID=A0A1X2HL86_SYNRA|nr:Prp18 domain-domain-containing protein [Syncephalastrum racemosum]